MLLNYVNCILIVEEEEMMTTIPMIKICMQLEYASQGEGVEMVRRRRRILELSVHVTNRAKVLFKYILL